MKIKKAVVTAAAPDQRSLPLQSLVDLDGQAKTALDILIEEAIAAGVDSIAVVVHPGDEEKYREGVADPGCDLVFIPQAEPRGYGHALLSAKSFVGGEAFLHLVSDHLCVSRESARCAQQLVKVAGAESCCVSAVQATRETMLNLYGVVGGRPVAGRPGQYEIEKILEKPTPTQAEQELVVPGLRAGHYLCFFGMHVLTPLTLDLLEEQARNLPEGKSLQLSPALAQVASRERFLAFEVAGSRYNIGVRYGLFMAQMALIMKGRDREEVLTQVVELLATQDFEA